MRGNMFKRKDIILCFLIILITILFFIVYLVYTKVGIVHEQHYFTRNYRNVETKQWHLVKADQKRKKQPQYGKSSKVDSVPLKGQGELAFEPISVDSFSNFVFSSYTRAKDGKMKRISCYPFHSSVSYTNVYEQRLAYDGFFFES